MGGINRIDQVPVRVDTQVADSSRSASKTSFSSRINDGSLRASDVAVSAPLVPGGAVISAAVTNFNGPSQNLTGGRLGMSAAFGVGGPGGTPAGSTTPTSSTTPALPGATGATGAVDPVNFMNMQSTSQIQFLMLQQQLQLENQKYTTLSNVMKVRHDTAKTAIGNLR